MRFRRQFCIAVVAAAVMMLVISISTGLETSADETSVDYKVEYRLFLTDYEDQADGSCNALLDLYVYYNDYAYTGDVMGGSIGLRYPTNMQVSFAEDSTNIQYVVPASQTENAYTADGQHFFMWTAAADAAAETIEDGNAPAAGTATAFGETVSTQGQDAGTRMYIGTYTLRMPAGFPSKSAVGELDWNNVALATAQDYANMNQMTGGIWSDVTPDGGDGICHYCGYYADQTTWDMVFAELPLLFTAPEEWSDAFYLLSYDPAKTIDLTLFDNSGNIVADGFTIPLWDDDDDDNGQTSSDSGVLYAATSLNTDSGIGPYYTAIDPDTCTIAENMAINAGETYILQIAKEGHLVRNIQVVAATDGTLAGAQGLPAEEALYLPAGDVNPVAAGADFSETVFGDGCIDMQDRTAILTLMGTDISDAAPGTMSYYADIDGDGYITQADLSILISPINWGQNTN